MKRYTQFNRTEREILWNLTREGKSFRYIAQILGRNVSSLTREYHRHSKLSAYAPAIAQAEANWVKKRQRQQAALKNREIWWYVLKRLTEDGWSPEEISGRIQKDKPRERIHHATIYRYLYHQAKKGSKLYRYLRFQHKQTQKQKRGKIDYRGIIADRTSIEARPQEINYRRRLGHWETDNMEGRKTDRSVLSVTVERMSRYTMISKLINKKASSKSQAMIARLQDLPQKARQTITYDNGFENRNHKEVKQALNVDTYFCNPYHSWEKGAVENTIGRGRKFIPKGKRGRKATSIDSVTTAEIQAIEDKMNNTPRKCLNYLTPKEVFYQLLQNL